VRRIGAEMVSEGIESVGICFLHSYANPAHEQRAAAILREVAPKAFDHAVVRSFAVIREYERGSTTTLNAMSCRRCGATSNGWPAPARARLQGPAALMQSNGGIALPRRQEVPDPQSSNPVLPPVC